VVRPLVAIALAVAIGCGVRAPELDPKERVRGEHQRVVQMPLDRLWPAVLKALPDEGLRVAQADHKRGTIATRPLRYTGRDLQKKIGEIGDLSRARSEGLGRVTEIEIAYFLLLSPAGDSGTNVRIRTSIDAIDRSDAVFLGPGIFQIVPKHIAVPSRGVAERELMRRLASALFTTEEMLFLLGEPGVD